MDYRILGSLEVVADGRAAELGPPKQRAVLAILLLHASEIVPTDLLIELVWGEHAPRTAAHSVQIYVSELRKALEPLAEGPVIATRPPGYVLQADPESIDARRFERLVEEGTRELEAGDRSDGAATLRTALGLWRGPPLSDLAYEEFAQPEIRRLEDLRLTAIEELAAAELALGHEKQVLPLIETAIREDPLRERSRELQMLALYRSGRHAEALHAYQQFRGLLGEELGLDPSPSLRRLQERILLHDPALGPEAPQEPAAAPAPGRNPYKGLRPFGEDDADDFFGRDALVGQLLEALAGGRRLVAVVGPSGCGKSSVVNAGLIPALRSGALPGPDGWVIAQMMPGRHPFEELEAALLRAAPDPPASLREQLDEEETALLRAALRILPGGGRLLLVIDQFEELFSFAEEPARLRFLRNLVTGAAEPHGHVRVVLTLRADFYDRPLQHSEFASVFTPGVVNVLPMTPEELEQAVVGPARRLGVEVEPALLAELVTDTADQPGGLPLLQYALTELFEQRTGPRLTLEEYRALGGLHGALSRRSEELYGRLDEERRQAALQVFLRLVRLGEGARHSRRRVPLAELTALDLDPVALSDVLEEFGRHRLLSFDRDPVTGDASVEVAHEALLWEWDRLAEWIERHRADLRRHDSLSAAAEEWESSGRNPDYLLTGSRLAEYEAWSADTTLQLTGKEREFLDAALERRRSEEAEEAARSEAQRRLERRARRRLLALIGTVAALTTAATLGVLAWLGSRPPDVVLVFDGPGDSGYNDMIATGFDRAVSDFGIDAEKLTPTTLGLETQLRQVSEEGVDLIFVGFSTQGGVVDAVAADHPDTRYVADACTSDLPNVSCITFVDEEGSFLVGAAAALKSETGTIGFIGGVDIPSIGRFQAGYEAGARAVDPDIKLLSEYLTEPPDFSGFGSPTLAADAAVPLYEEGADVIFHAAGYSGWGLFDVAADLSEELGRYLWAIGVDNDQYRSIGAAGFPEELDPAAWPPHVLTSMVKRIDNATYAVLAEYSRGIFTPGVRELGLAEGGVDISYSGGFIDDIRPQIERLRQQIIAGEIEVPTVPADKAGLPAPSS